MEINFNPWSISSRRDILLARQKIRSSRDYITNEITRRLSIRDDSYEIVDPAEYRRLKYKTGPIIGYERNWAAYSNYSRSLSTFNDARQAVEFYHSLLTGLVSQKYYIAIHVDGTYCSMCTISVNRLTYLEYLAGLNRSVPPDDVLIITSEFDARVSIDIDRDDESKVNLIEVISIRRNGLSFQEALGGLLKNAK